MHPHSPDRSRSRQVSHFLFRRANSSEHVTPVLDSAWPLAEKFGFARPAFMAAFGQRLEVVGVDVEGLVLAAACAAGLGPALMALDREVLPEVRKVLLRRADGAVVEDVLQQTRLKLVLGNPPGFLQYAGRGPLIGFVRTVAVHLLANLEAAAKPMESDERLATLPGAAEVEAGLLRADQQAHFKEAFRAAVAGLSVRQRSLLRLNLVEGLSIDEIAPMFGAHRSSAARWLVEAKECLARLTRVELASRLRLEGEALESLLRSVQDRFDLSLQSALKD